MLRRRLRGLGESDRETRVPRSCRRKPSPAGKLAQVAVVALGQVANARGEATCYRERTASSFPPHVVLLGDVAVHRLPHEISHAAAAPCSLSTEPVHLGLRKGDLGPDHSGMITTVPTGDVDAFQGAPVRQLEATPRASGTATRANAAKETCRCCYCRAASACGIGRRRPGE